MQVVAFDLIDGKLVPVEPEGHDYTQPPEGLNRQQRRQWPRRYRDYLKQYEMKPDVAWFYATKAVRD